MALSKEYGEVFAIYTGPKRKIVACGAKSMKEMLIEKGTHFAGRPQENYKLYLASMGFKDIIAEDYTPQLKYLRKLFTRGLNLHGLNKKLTKETISKHADALIERLKEFSGKTLNPKDQVQLSIMNVILHMVFGKEIGFEDPLFVKTCKATTLLFNGIKPGPEDIFFWLRYFPNKNIREVKEGAALRDEITPQIIKEHRDTYTPGVIRDMTDAMLAAEAEELAIGGSRLDHSSFTMLINETFMAGFETTSSTIMWMLMFLAKFPEKQTKLREELQQVELGSLDDINPSVLPYTYAAIYEAQRLASVGALVAHKATRDTSLCGLPVEKNTPVILNLYGVSHDENLFHKPNEYVPERWINDDGEYQPDSCVLPFSAGPRTCPGRQLATMVLFTFITKLVRSISFQEVVGHENNIDVEYGFTLSPKDVKLMTTKIEN